MPPLLVASHQAPSSCIAAKNDYKRRCDVVTKTANRRILELILRTLRVSQNTLEMRLNAPTLTRGARELPGRCVRCSRRQRVFHLNSIRLLEAATFQINQTARRQSKQLHANHQNCCPSSQRKQQPFRPADEPSGAEQNSTGIPPRPRQTSRTRCARMETNRMTQTRRRAHSQTSSPPPCDPRCMPRPHVGTVSSEAALMSYTLSSLQSHCYQPKRRTRVALCVA